MRRAFRTSSLGREALHVRLVLSICNAQLLKAVLLAPKFVN